jgi:ubiquinone/menaquinone biosynthesis C-methylase UbiE
MDDAQNPTENENTYVLDAESGAELVRMIKQDAIVTKAIESLLPRQVDSAKISRVLDIACGPGSWVLDVAYEYSNVEVIGVDISRKLVEYARTRARSQGLENNAIFKVMDVTKPLDFPDESFDIINGRFLIGFMSPGDWPKLLRECMRITRPGGFIRLTECDDMGTTSSQAFEQYMAMVYQALRMAGRTFAPTGKNFNVTPMLAGFQGDAGYQHVDTIPHVVDFSSGAEAHISMYENWMAGLELLQPFLVKMRMATLEELKELYQQALIEMMSNDFRALWYFLSVVGQRPL